MERHPGPMGWRTQHGKNANSPQTDVQLNTAPTKFPVRLFVAN